MAASALFVLDLKGRIILSRDYRGDVPVRSIEKFISKVNELEDTGTLLCSISVFGTARSTTNF